MASSLSQLTQSPPGFPKITSCQDALSPLSCTESSPSGQLYVEMITVWEVVQVNGCHTDPDLVEPVSSEDEPCMVALICNPGAQVPEAEGLP